MLVALHVKHKQNQFFFFFFPIFGNYHFSTAVPKSLLQQVDPCRSLQWSLGYWILSFGSSHTLNYLMYVQSWSWSSDHPAQFSSKSNVLWKAPEGLLKQQNSTGRLITKTEQKASRV